MKISEEIAPLCRGPSTSIKASPRVERAGMSGLTMSFDEGERGWSQFSCTMVEGGRKRLREEDDGILFSAGSGSRTPTLVCTRRRLVQVKVKVNEDQLDEGDQPLKRFKGDGVVVAVVASKSKPAEAKPQSGLLGKLPEDVVSHCLSFLNSVEDRFSLQTTCKQFRRISNSDKMLVNIRVGGDRETGQGGIVQDGDTAETAAVVLAPFSQAGNLEAIYM